MKFNNVSLEVFVRGRPITEYPHNGQVFVEGRPGSQYEIIVRNFNSYRIEAVVSVDGLSVIDGKDAGPQSSGYLIEPMSSITIPGWKLDNVQAAAFEFAGKRDSYANHVKGSSHNVGVIGLLAYKIANPDLYHSFRVVSSSAEPTSGSWYSPSVMVGSGVTRGMSSVASYASAEPVATMSMATSHTAGTVELTTQNIGTGFGTAVDFSTSTVDAKREDMIGMIVLHYDDVRGLRARGVPLAKPRRVKTKNRQPNPFPGMSGCTPPPGWNG